MTIEIVIESTSMYYAERALMHFQGEQLKMISSSRVQIAVNFCQVTPLSIKKINQAICKWYALWS